MKRGHRFYNYYNNIVIYFYSILKNLVKNIYSNKLWNLNKINLKLITISILEYFFFNKY